MHMTTAMQLVKPNETLLARISRLAFIGVPFYARTRLCFAAAGRAARDSHYYQIINIHQVHSHSHMDLHRES